MDRTPSRAALVALLGLLSCGSNPPKPHSQADTTRATIPVGESTFVCPPGNANAVFLQLFRLNRPASSALFPEGRESRPAKGSFEVEKLRRLIAGLAHTPPESVVVGAAQFGTFKEDRRTLVILSSRGDGFALLVKVTALPNAQVNICQVLDSSAKGASSQDQIRFGDTILLRRLLINGAPYALALRAVNEPDKPLMQDEMAFAQGASKSRKEMTDLLPTFPTEEVSACLQSSRVAPRSQGPSSRRHGARTR